MRNRNRPVFSVAHKRVAPASKLSAAENTQLRPKPGVAGAGFLLQGQIILEYPLSGETSKRWNDLRCGTCQQIDAVLRRYSALLGVMYTLVLSILAVRLQFKFGEVIE